LSPACGGLGIWRAGIVLRHRVASLTWAACSTAIALAEAAQQARFTLPLQWRVKHRARSEAANPTAECRRTRAACRFEPLCDSGAWGEILGRAGRARSVAFARQPFGSRGSPRRRLAHAAPTDAGRRFGPCKCTISHRIAALGLARAVLCSRTVTLYSGISLCSRNAPGSGALVRHGPG